MSRWRCALVKVIAAAASGTLLTFFSAWTCTLWSPPALNKPINKITMGWTGFPLRSPLVNETHAHMTGIGFQIDVWRGAASNGDHYLEQVMAAGFPFPSLGSRVRQSSDMGTIVTEGLSSGISLPERLGRTRVLISGVGSKGYVPVRPILPGFALNTLFYATFLFTLFSTPPAIRRHLRRRRNHCPTCNYNLHNLPTPTCPECGPASSPA
jgi:hypothetical protein